MRIWIARDVNGDLALFLAKPRRRDDDWTCDLAFENAIWLDPDRFPNITWENSPKEFVLNED